MGEHADSPLVTPVDEPLAGAVRVSLHLDERGRDARGVDEPRQLREGDVADAERPGEPAVVEPFEPAPRVEEVVVGPDRIAVRPGRERQPLLLVDRQPRERPQFPPMRPRIRPVQRVAVERVDTEFSERAATRPLEVAGAVVRPPRLPEEEHRLAVGAAGSLEEVAETPLVAVQLRRVEQPIAGVERRAHRRLDVVAVPVARAAEADGRQPEGCVGWVNRRSRVVHPTPSPHHSPSIRLGDAVCSGAAVAVPVGGALDRVTDRDDVCGPPRGALGWSPPPDIRGQPLRSGEIGRPARRLLEWHRGVRSLRAPEGDAMTRLTAQITRIVEIQRAVVAVQFEARELPAPMGGVETRRQADQRAVDEFERRFDVTRAIGSA